MTDSGEQMLRGISLEASRFRTGVVAKPARRVSQSVGGTQ